MKTVALGYMVGAAPILELSDEFDGDFTYSPFAVRIDGISFTNHPFLANFAALPLLGIIPVNI
jgi:hypothetical protein